MGSLLVSAPLFLASVLIVTSAQQDFSIQSFCWYEGGNFTANSSYSDNLNHLISSLSTLTPNTFGFYNISFGQTAVVDKVNAIAMCRGDVRADDCVRCIADAGKQLVNRCPKLIEADIWLEKCMFRYTIRNILGTMEAAPYFYASSNVNVTNKGGFNEALGELLDSLGTRVLVGRNQNLKFAAGLRRVDPVNQTIYALAQCTPDLSESDCRVCLVQIFAGVPTCCDGKTGGSWMNPSCNFRFDVFPFFDLAFLSEEHSSSPRDNSRRTGQGKVKGSAKIVIIVVVPVVAIVICISCFYVYLKTRKKIQNRKDGTADEIVSVDSLHFDFNAIRVASDDFSLANKIGEGGFGTVYKGRLQNGQEIAVKRLSIHSGQGDTEFKNEVLLMAKLQHKNLVRLLGFCIKGEERLLVYEFIPNMSLDRFLFDPIERNRLSWEKRYDIITGISRGMLYLHEGTYLPIIHRDLKASNVLLDEKFQPKISDFGMARQFDFDKTQETTRRVVGTYGYMAPEYAMHGRFSVKTDVYSFGILVLEITTGQRNNGFGQGENTDLPSFVWTRWIEGTSLVNLVDPTLQSHSKKQAARCMEIALLCVQENPTQRPTMATVVSMLSHESLPLPKPSQPAYYKHSPRDTLLSEAVNDVSVTELSAR